MKQKLSKIELLLMNEDFDLVLKNAYKIKSSEDPNSEDSYLIDFYIGQALFRKGLSKNLLNPLFLDKILEHLNLSLEKNDNYDGTHLLAGFSYQVLSKFRSREDQETSREKAIYHFTKAKKINPSLEEECNKNLNVLLDIAIILVGRNQDKVEVFKNQFLNYPKVSVVQGNILDQKCDAIVSPANSFGFMDGGLDYQLSEYFGWELQDSLQELIKKNHDGELLVGQAEVIPTNKSKIPYLISAPTMRVPLQLGESSVNAYLSTRAALLAVKRLNRFGGKIKKIAFPLMCTGVGKMSSTASARQMRTAYDEVVLYQQSFPDDFGEAQLRNVLLFSDEYNQGVEDYKRKCEK